MDQKIATYNSGMSQKAPAANKTYFGIAALSAGILCDLSLALNFGVSQLEITRRSFDPLNQLTALFYCILTPLALILGAVAYTRKDDSKSMARIGIVLAVIPFLFTFARLAYAFIFR